MARLTSKVRKRIPDRNSPALVAVIRLKIRRTPRTQKGGQSSNTTKDALARRPCRASTPRRTRSWVRVSRRVVSARGVMSGRAVLPKARSAEGVEAITTAVRAKPRHVYR